MKRKLLLLPALFLLLSISCKKEESNDCGLGSDEQPKGNSFLFNVTDSLDRNVFFGQDSIYDPKQVQIKYGEGGDFLNLWDSAYFSPYFRIEEIYYSSKNVPRVFYLKFHESDLDTLQFNFVSIDEYCNNALFKATFNSVVVCSSCDNNTIYSIVK